MDNANQDNDTPPEDQEKPNVFETESAISSDIDNTRSFGKGGKWYSIINIEPRGVTVFFRQLATLIGSGMPMLRALRTISNSSERDVRYVVNEIANDVEHGQSLSFAMSKFPKIFSKIHINLIIVAEKGGSLEDTLRGVANLSENEDRTRMRVKRSLLYPAVTLFIATGVLIFVLSYVLPRFISAILGSAENLTPLTRCMVNVSNFFNTYWWALLLSAFILSIYIYFSSKSTFSKRFWDRLKLEIPILGVILKKISIMNFCRSFGMLIRNGVPALQALRLLQETTDNLVFAQIFRKTCISVENGSNISEPLSESRMFSPFVIDMIITGESSGQLDSMMIKIADSYQDEVDQITQNLGTLVEPILLLIIGSFVALIVFSVFSTYVQTLKVLS